MKYLPLLLLLSCASADEWQAETVSQDKEVWSWCNREIDPEEYHDKGWCWSYEEFKWERKFLKKEKVYRTKWKFCEAGNIACIKDNKLDDKILINPSDIF